MSKGNKATRNRAVPFFAEPFLVAGALSLTIYDSLDSLAVPTLTTPLTKIIPLTRPQKGDVVEASLFMRMIAPSDKALNVRIGIGQMTSDIPVVSYSETYIQQQHEAITGQTAPFNVAANGTLVVEANLHPFLPKRGEANFYQEAWALLVSFDSLPDVDNGYDLDKFFVACSTQIGVNR